MIPHQRMAFAGDAVALAMPLDARPGLGEDVTVARLGFLPLSASGRLAEQQRRAAGPGFEECPSVHRPSKQQGAAGLKVKSARCPAKGRPERLP